MVPLVRAACSYCVRCPPPSRSNEEAREEGGYTIDAGNDAAVRESIASALEYRRNKVREAFVAGTRAPSLAHARAHADICRASYRFAFCRN